MSVTVNPPKTPVTEGSNGIAAATVPNVCKMPGPPAPFVPTPLPNIGKSSNSPKGYSKTVTIEGNKIAIKGATFKSMGDIASKGTGGGIVSQNTEGPTSFVGPGSMDVKVEGKNVQLLGDPMLNNCGPSGTPANSATLVGLVQLGNMKAVAGDEECPLCKKTHGEAAKLEESSKSQQKADELKTSADQATRAANADFDANHRAALERKNEELAQAQYDAALKRHTKKAESLRSTCEKIAGLSGKEALHAEKSAELAKHMSQAPKKNDPQPVPPLKFRTMLAVVLCRDQDKVFAACTRHQVKELVEKIPGGWHMQPGNTTIFRSNESESSAEGAARMTRFKGFVTGNRTGAASDGRGWGAVFEEQWQKAITANGSSFEGKGPPAFTPGTCAGPQAAVLAMDHGHRPAYVTERAYHSHDPDYKVSVRYRTPENPNPKPPVKEFGGKDAVPPCESCQIILPMLICPEGKSVQCEDKAPGEKGVCKCQA